MANPAHSLPQTGYSREAALFLRDVIDGLSRPQKTLPCKYFYDKRGSELFDMICTLPEYYPTRTELAIMQDHAAAITDALGSDVMLIEYGSGSSLKTRLLLKTLRGLAGYVPIDISRRYLLSCSGKLKGEFPGLAIHPVCADYTQPLQFPASVQRAPKRVVYFPGSTIGNFFPADAQRFLERMARSAGRGGRLLIGVDLQKDRETLEAAYNDSQGITAAFNLNVLRRINDELDGDFTLDAFEHRAPYNGWEGRIEMHLVSRTDQTVTVAKRNEFRFSAGESVRTECSYKYTVDSFARLAAAAGFTLDEVYLDERALFSVQLLTVA
ncbi:MAG: L-histidine N(alpha)-methyltransferase [Candidatus Hydrogenedentes bacterium]|nr:L-histidine N(alpha)-methyltransferase [Candidatus Hydrogenedentota bacterium]